MSSVNYIELEPSTGGGKKYRVVVGTRQRYIAKTQSRRRTLTGRMDNSEGTPVTGIAFTVRVRNVATGSDPDGSDYGVLADLRTLYSLNDPNGTPTNVITFTDHDGDDFDVHLVGQLTEELITPTFDGNNSWYYLALVLEKI